MAEIYTFPARTRTVPDHDHLRRALRDALDNAAATGPRDEALALLRDLHAKFRRYEPALEAVLRDSRVTASAAHNR